MTEQLHETIEEVNYLLAKLNISDAFDKDILYKRLTKFRDRIRAVEKEYEANERKYPERNYLYPTWIGLGLAKWKDDLAKVLK